MSARASLAGWLGAAALVVVLTAPQGDASADAGAEACDVVDVEYALAARLQLTDTPLGKGDGTYTIGPGTAVLRFDRRGGAAAVATHMVSYRMRESFTIQSTALFWTTTVITDAATHATPDMCMSAADGVLTGRTLHWNGPVRGYATQGSITCDGTLCGTFGAPPPGRSELRIAPHPVPFSPFEFAADGKTFTMGSTFVSRTDSPKQTAHLVLSGREMRRTCVAPPSCG